jgi:CheY-like chemotaxis protein
MVVVTDAGRQAWESGDAAVCEEYRLFLWLIDVQGAVRAFKGLLEDHSVELLREWLRELQLLGLIRRAAPGEAVPERIAVQSAAQSGSDASTSLQTMGAFVAPKSSRSVARPRSASDSAILIVEDDIDALALAKLRVSMAGYQVRIARSVIDMVSSLRLEGLPDLLLLDILLPDGNGFDVLAKMRRNPRFRALPIVMLTVLGEAADIAKGLALGADGYVVKPYSKEVLEDVIERVLS